jgi:hypothetical protein
VSDFDPEAEYDKRHFEVCQKICGAIDGVNVADAILACARVAGVSMNQLSEEERVLIEPTVMEMLYLNKGANDDTNEMHKVRRGS